MVMLKKKKKKEQVPLESQHGSRNEGGGIQSKNSCRAQHNIILSMRFPRQKYWSGLSFPSAGNLPDSGIKSISLALAGQFFTTEPPGKTH